MSEKFVTISEEEYKLLCRVHECGWDHFQATHDPKFRRFVGGVKKQVKPLHEAVKAYAKYREENEGD